MKKIVIVLSLCLLFSCSSNSNIKHNMAILKEKEPTLKLSNNFNGYLALEYINFAQELLADNKQKLSKNNKKNIVKVLDKAISASGNNIIMPEDPLFTKAKNNEIAEMISAQKRMEIILNPAIKALLPIQSAHLFYSYDCWAIKEAGNFDVAPELAKCKSRFYQLISELEEYYDKGKKIALEQTLEGKKQELKKFEIEFNYDSAELSNISYSSLSSLIEYLKDKGDRNIRIILIGNDDGGIKEIKNAVIAKNRVIAIKNYLIDQGLPTRLLESYSEGENFPDIISKEGYLKVNRTVAVFVVSGGSFLKKDSVFEIENEVYRQELLKNNSNRGVDSKSFRSLGDIVDVSDLIVKDKNYKLSERATSIVDGKKEIKITKGRKVNKKKVKKR